jgi:LPXTG-site transpeptidase (sortase) family protein
MRDNTSRINSDEIRGRIRGYQPRAFINLDITRRSATATPRPIDDIKPVENKSQPVVFQSKNIPTQQVIKRQQLPTNTVVLKNIARISDQPTKSNPKVSKKELKTTNKNNLINNLLLSMAVIVFLAGVFASLYSLKEDKQITETVAAQSANPDSEVSEDKPSAEAVRNYSVSPEMPKLIKIPKLGTTARISQIGLKSNGQLDVPKNIHDAAWYKDSALPGSPGGASIIDGHVSGPTQKGVFHNLSNLISGDIVTIEKGNGENINYRVIKVETLAVNDVNMANMLVPITPGSHGLNIISCTGKYDTEKNDFEQRVLVYTEKI